MLKTSLKKLKKTLKKKDKLKLKSEFENVRIHGEKIVSKGFLTVVAKSFDGISNVRCGVICSRKYSVLAVRRNRARRLLFESFRLLKHDIEPCHIVLIPRKRMQDYKLDDTLTELRNSLKKSEVLR